MQIVSVEGDPSAAAAGAKAAVVLEQSDIQLNVNDILSSARKSGAITDDSDGYETIWVVFKEEPRTVIPVYADQLRKMLWEQYCKTPDTTNRRAFH